MPHAFQQLLQAAVLIILATDLILIGRLCTYLIALFQWRQSLRRPEVSTAADLPNSGVPRPTLPFAADWSLAHPLIAVQIVVVLAAFLNVTVLAMAGALPTSPLEHLTSRTTNATLFALFIQEVLFIAAVVLFLRRYRSSLRDIGLRMVSAKQFWFAAGLGLAMFLLSGIAETGLSAILHRMMSPSAFQSLEQWAKTSSAEGLFTQIPHHYQKGTLIVIGVIFAPMAEELFFRGFLYNALVRRFSKPAAVLVSAACFALLHMNPLSMGIIFIMGIVLAVVYQRTGSLTLTIIVHALNNGLSFAALMMHR